MSEMSREALLGVVREVWEERDPVPTELVSRMQAAIAAADLDLELMQLLERSADLVGARNEGTTTYTLRFVHGETDLLLRVAVEEAQSRIDGWVVPPEPMTVRAISGDRTPRSHDAVVTESGRFELVDLPGGLLRLRLEPHGGGRGAIATPYFEI